MRMTDGVRLVKGVLGRGWGVGGVNQWVCASLSTLYPLFIESKPG